MDTFTLHWAFTGLVGGFVSFEFASLIQFKLTFDYKFWEFDPISLELSEPDWISGDIERI